jgi:DNA repair exonuclease SbcCD nuclease subunit
MKTIISGDWHLNLANRWYDFTSTVTQLVKKVIEIRPKYFVFCGDGFLNCHPLPIEMALFRRAILEISESGIVVILVIGNHDVAESETFQGRHALFEFKDWGIHNEGRDNIILIDTPETMIDFSDKLSAIIIPHLPKASIEVSYAETYKKVLSEMVVMVPKGKKIALFTHAYIAEAVLGANDLTVNTKNAVPKSVIEDAGVHIAFVSDIHRAQKIGEKIYLPGSIERVDFGEAGDIKGMICYDDVSGEVEFIELDSRKLEQVIIDLVNPGFIKMAVNDEGVPDGPKAEPVLDPYEYIMGMLAEFKMIERLKDAIVKIRVVCTKEQKFKMDICEEKIKAYLLDSIKINALKSFTYEIVDNVSVRCAEVNESLSPANALLKWVEMGKENAYKEETKQRIILEGNRIIKSY